MITLILILHILGAAFLFGSGLGTAFYMFFANQNGDLVIIAKATRLVVRADWIFTGIWGVIQPITGGLLIYLKGYSISAPWLIGSVAGYLIAGGFWLPVVYFQIQLSKMAATALEQKLERKSELPSRYFRLYRYWILCGFPAFIALVGVFYLMANGPTLGG